MSDRKPREAEARQLEGRFDAVVQAVRSIYGRGDIPLHRPVFQGREREYLVDCIDSNFVSSVGQRVDEFEATVARYTGAGHAVATVNGTTALHVALQLAGVQPGDEVVTQALTFVATCNAIRYAGATPAFVDVDEDTMGMSPTALSRFLEDRVELRHGHPYNRNTGRRIAACLPMHTFGRPCRIDEIAQVCAAHRIALVEDAAESLGSFSKGRHTGTIGLLGTLSFNGNKIITTGGGGMVLTDDAALAKRAKHLTTTAKCPHPYEFRHDELGFNYRMPNLNAALGCAQMERLPWMLEQKAMVARTYASTLSEWLVAPLPDAVCNHWLNALAMPGRRERDLLLEYTNARGVMTRPIWELMSDLPMYRDCERDGLETSRSLADRIVNIPSSVPMPDTETVRG